MRFCITVAVVVVSVVTFASAPAAATAADKPKRVRASSAYLFDAGEGRTLWARNARSRRPIGSIAKVMTALVVARSGDLDRTVRIRARHLSYATKHNGSTAGLRPGDRFTARELLYALLLPSGSDAAVALAESYGPGRRAFIRKMNRTAKGLGMARTYYANFDGLPYPNPYAGYSTAGDLVTLAAYVLADPVLRVIVGTRRHVLKRQGPRHGRYVWRNTNELLGDYPGMLGIKSGHTTAAGYSLLFAAHRFGRTLIGVVLNSSGISRAARFIDTVRLLNWGFRRSR